MHVSCRSQLGFEAMTANLAVVSWQAAIEPVNIARLFASLAFLPATRFIHVYRRLKILPLGEDKLTSDVTETPSVMVVQKPGQTNFNGMPMGNRNRAFTVDSSLRLPSTKMPAKLYISEPKRWPR